jgi:protein gp37
VSCEPLLGAVDLAKWLGPLPWIGHNDRVQWVIAGGESGRGYRHPAGLVGWVHDLREQALKASATFHFKQWGGHSPTAGGRSLDGETWDDFPAGIGSGCLSLVQRIMAS